MSEEKWWLEPPKEEMPEDPYDSRDLVFDETMGADEPVPSLKDGYDVVKKYNVPLEEDPQHYSLACVAHAGTDDIETQVFISVGEKIHLSRRDAYSQIHLGGGGASPRDFYKLANKVGVCEDKYCPTYDSDRELTEARARLRGEITKERTDNALSWRIGAYRSIKSNDIGVLARAIYLNNGCAGGFRSIGASMGHMIFHKGFGYHKGYPGICFKDSYHPFEKWLIQNKGKFYQDNPRGVRVELFSIWTAEPNPDWSIKKKMTKEEVEAKYWQICVEPWNDGLRGFVGQSEEFTEAEMMKSKRRKHVEEVMGASDNNPALLGELLKKGK